MNVANPIILLVNTVYVSLEHMILFGPRTVLKFFVYHLQKEAEKENATAEEKTESPLGSSRR